MKKYIIFIAFVIVCMGITFFVGIDTAYDNIIEQCSKQQSIIYKNNIPAIECGPIETVDET